MISNPLLFRFPVLALTMAVLLAAPATPRAAAQDSPNPDPPVPRQGQLIRITLPINDLVSRRVRQSLQQISDRAPATVRPENRPVVVLEFDTSSGQSGRGSELEACQSLARWLTSTESNSIQTVAYVPQADPDAMAGSDNTATLTGHAVLVAIAADQLALELGTSLGDAGADESRLGPLVRTVYQTIAEERSRLPPLMVMALLDPEQSLYRVVEPGTGTARFVDGDQLRELEATGAVNSQTLSTAGQPLKINAEQLEAFRLTELAPQTRTDLARQLRIQPTMLAAEVDQAQDWKAIQIALPFLIDGQAESWLLSRLLEEVNGGVNLVVLVIEDSIGELPNCLSLSRRLAELSGRDVRTVAFVKGRAQQGVGLIALACDDLIMAPQARLGGVDPDAAEPVDSQRLDELQSEIEALATAREAPWSLFRALVDPELQLTKYVNRTSGELQLLCNREAQSIDYLEDLAPLGPVSLGDGVSGETAAELRLARLIAEDMGQIQTFYQLDQPPESIELTATYRRLDRLAQILTNPLASMLLLMGGFFFLSTEMSAPGLSVPGFLGAVCFLLFFWSHFFEGSAVWFEILMFGLGVACLMLELFVIPGLGIFGIGGVTLMMLSIVLAAQDFVIPSSVEEISQLPRSLTPVIGGGIGVLAAAWMLRNVLPNSPYLRQLMLSRRDRDPTGLETRSDPEAIVDWSGLLDQKGETVTRLAPAGKARIEGHVYNVISNGPLIDKGSSVVVVEAVGNRIVVQADEDVRG